MITVLKTAHASIGDLAVHVKGDGPPVVLLHANPGDHRDFNAIVPELARAFTTYAVDWPANGDSPAPADPAAMSAMAFASALPEVLDGLGLERAALIGNSVGGYAALRLAIDDPARVSALVLANSGGFSSAGVFTRAATRVIGTKAAMRLLAGRLPRAYLRRRTPVTRAMIERDVARRRNPAALAQAAAIWRSFGQREHDLRRAAAAVTTPTLLVWGTRDPVVGVFRRAARRALPHAEYHPMRTGHATFAEDPEGFLAAVIPFLATAFSRSAGSPPSAGRSPRQSLR